MNRRDPKPFRRDPKPFIWITFLGVVFGFTGFLAGRVIHKFQVSQEASLAAGTLKGLVLALEDARLKTGKYPEDLISIDGTSFVEGDYSKAIAADVIYCRTATGYFMAVGVPVFAFTDQTGHIRTKVVK